MFSYKTQFGDVTLSRIEGSNDSYEVYDSIDDTYRGTIQFNNNETINSNTVSSKLKSLYDYVVPNH